MADFIVRNGFPLEFGAAVQDDGVNFSIYSKSATKVVLCIFDSNDAKQPSVTFDLDPVKNKTGDVWHIFVCGLKAGSLYLYKMDGPYNPPAGLRFNFHKYLIDPYAKCLSKGSVFESYNKQRSSGLAVKENGELSDLSNFPKCVVVDDSDFDWENDKPLNYPLEKTIIYETHLKGFTANKNSQVKNCGTYKGFSEKAEYLKSLGVTSVELLPIFEFDENENPRINPRTGEKLTNYWGYSTISFFAPKTGYSSSQKDGDSVKEFKQMVKILHQKGIEVILDVVFNHTAEGNEYGYTFSMRGIQNDVYYMLSQNEKQYYMNFSGCGNTVNCNHPVVRKFILDCLRYWVLQMHVDGFRFDLATVLTRGQAGNILDFPSLTNEINEDPILSKTKIIAEAWDCGGYQVGEFPGGSRWCEWNGRYRDDLRRFLRGDENLATATATRIAGNSDIYKRSGRSPLASINFITCHDGFTLNDLVSYNYKHNEENGENNCDGTDDNLSYNRGFEGPAVNPKIESSRLKTIKNAMLFLMISQGVPMILGGDEMRRTQLGNNNAYCQDNQLSYFDWSLCEKNSGLVRFVSELVKLRRNHLVFCRTEYFPEANDKGKQQEIFWYDSNGKSPDWNKLNRFLGFKLAGSNEKHSDNDFFVAANNDIYDLTVTLPPLSNGKKWFRVADTSFESPDDILENGNEEILNEQRRYVLVSGSSIILIAK